MVLCIVLCMTRVNISIPAMKLSRIDLYCKENKIERSRLLTMGAMAIVNKGKISKCEFCYKEAIGKFEVSYYDENLGMTSTEKFLCEAHKKESDKRNEVSEI